VGVGLICIFIELHILNEARVSSYIQAVLRIFFVFIKSLNINHVLYLLIRMINTNNILIICNLGL